MTATPRAVELVEIAAAAAADKLATDMIAYDVSDQLVITDAFLLCSASNDRQVRSVVDEIEEKLRRVGAKPVHREGEHEGRWVLLTTSTLSSMCSTPRSACSTRWNGCGRTARRSRCPAAIAGRADQVRRVTGGAEHDGRWTARPVARGGRRAGPAAGPMLRLLLWRHRQTALNAERRFQGHSDISLDETRREQAHTPPATWLPCTRMRICLRPRPGRRDRRVPGWAHRAARAARQGPARAWRRCLGRAHRPGDPENYPEAYSEWAPPDGEPISAVADRVSAVFERVTDSVERSLAVLVSHGAAISLGIARLLGLPERNRVLGPLGNCSWSVLGTRWGNWRLLERNVGRLRTSMRGRCRYSRPDLKRRRWRVRRSAPRKRRLTVSYTLAWRCGRFPSRLPRGYSSAGRALAWHARGQEFESP